MRQSEILTNQRVKNLTAPGRYPDGDRLYLQVGQTETAKSWLLRYELDGRERWMGLGPYPLVGLKDARERARLAKLKLLDGIDPIEDRWAERDKRRKDEAEKITFKEAVEKFHRLFGDKWRSEKHRRQWLKTMQDYAYPALKLRPVRAIDAAVINEALAPYWNTRAATASRVRERVHRICKWVNEGMPLPNASRKGSEGKHFTRLPYSEIPTFMAELREQEGAVARALELTILTATRTKDVTDAKWAEFDLKRQSWTIPAERHKSGRSFNVPLSKRVVEILESLPSEGELVFIGKRKGCGMGHNAMLELAQKMRPKITVHGFRSSFMDWANETTNHPNIVTKMALSHKISDKVERAYRRGDLFAKRSKLMSDWATYCASTPADIVPLREAV